MVTKVLTPILFEVTGRKRTVVLHHDRLKPCCDRSIPLWLRRKRNQVLGKSIEGFEKVHNNLKIEDLHLDKLFTDDYQNANHIEVRDVNTSVTHDSVDSKVGQELPVPATTRSGRERRRPKHLEDYYS